MAHAWMAEARRIRASTDGGPLHGGAPRAVWLALGTAPNADSIASAAQRLAGEHRPCHLLWDPATGEIVQLVSALRAARALRPRRSGHDRGAADVNTEGRICVQIGVLADPSDPFTHGPLMALEEIVKWLDSWGIPRRWPAGNPAPNGCSRRSRALWARGGHFAASQVPSCENTGPGGIDIDLITGSAMRHPGQLSPVPVLA